MGWRLVIPRIGVDAQIESVGRTSRGAMASPSSLDTVGWFNRGPSPGEPGDAVIDGHYGVWDQPGIFRKLRWLRPGDAVQVVWPDGRMLEFEVATSQVVPANAHPTGVFALSGPARLSLITCTGAWDALHATYSDRLIVTAVPT
jgi:sortase (surface protein transpeptidase)